MSPIDREVALGLWQEGFQVSVIAATLEVPWRQVWTLVRRVPRTKHQFDGEKDTGSDLRNPIYGGILPDTSGPVQARICCVHDASRLETALRSVVSLLGEGER
jgi:hypothetical protein